MALCEYGPEALHDIATQLGELAELLEKESKRLADSGPDAKVSVNFQLSTRSPLLKGLNTITQFVGAVVAAGGHASIAQLAANQEAKRRARGESQ